MPELTHGSVRLIGRFDLGDPAGPRCAWPGSALHARFSGTSVALRLRGSSDHFAVVLDGAPLPPLAATPGRELYPIATGLPRGEHELRIIKRTEPLVSEAQLLGLELDEAGALLPPAPAAERRIELVGDSITAGYGVLGDEGSSFSPANEDFCLSYGALAAAALGAEPVAVAWSGRGLVRNYDDEPGDPMPLLYERTLPARSDSRWDFTRWAPQVVVINLGTNDFSLNRPPPWRTFSGTYASLLWRIRSVYPSAAIVCALGPMLEGGVLSRARGYLDAAVELAGRDGVDGLHRIEFPPCALVEGRGADGHPSRTTHARMAEQLAGAVRTLLRW